MRLCLLPLLVACAPKLGDQPKMVGPSAAQVGIICGQEELSAEHSTWVKLVVKHEPGVQVDWAGSGLSLDQVAITHRSDGAPWDDRGRTRRDGVLWVRAQQPPRSGEVVGSVGPFHLRYRDAQGRQHEVDSPTCPMTIHG
jgi:hypothetical protein